MQRKRSRNRRHVIFIGETGSGKSSAINLLLGTASAPVSNDSRPCTETGKCYETTLYGTTYCLWDSRGLGEARGFLQILFGGSSEKDLKKLLKERHSRQEIDLVVFCIRGSRATEAATHYYQKLCSPTRKLAAPVAVVITQLEKENDMEDWWKRTCSRLEELGMEFDDHVCVTTLAEHPRLPESRVKLVDVITRYHDWEPEASGSYFGSLVPKKPTNLTSQRSSPSGVSSSSLLSMFPLSSDSSCTSYSEVYLESLTEEDEDSPTELPFKLSTSTIRRRRTYASHSGAFGDVWECDLISSESTRIVAVKAVRINMSSNGDLRPHEKKLRRELKIWGRLRHRNVVPLLGVVSGFGHLPSTVSKLQKQRLLGDIAVGLRYLHSQDVVHGDLHSGNVLIDDDGTACLTDFGLSFTSDFVGTSYLNSNICGGVSFADPELVMRAYNSQINVIYPTMPCDIYSFGGIMLHVLSGQKPYDGIGPAIIFATVMKGERPLIPTHITQDDRSLIRACWAQEKGRRPLADALVGMFNRQ